MTGLFVWLLDFPLEMAIDLVNQNKFDFETGKRLSTLQLLRPPGLSHEIKMGEDV